MAHDVYISFVGPDKAVADAICATLENNNIRCWIAPRDISPGQKIVVALNETIRLMKEIDEVIEKHGGWPGAFVAGT